jgi:hypothetical protein
MTALIAFLAFLVGIAAGGLCGVLAVMGWIHAHEREAAELGCGTKNS